MLCTLLCLLPFKAGAQSPVGIAVGGDNLTRLLWNNPNGSIALWKIAADGSVAAQNSYGPYPGWSASAVGMGPDSFARVLCTHPADGQMSLWRVDPSSPASFTAANYGPYAGWVAASLAVGGSNAPRVLWNHPVDSQMSLWNITPDTTFTQGTYGPYSGYRASFVASGPNSIARVLWTYSDGSISFWNGVPDAGSFSFQNYGPYPGWSAAALAVDSGNAPRLLWNHPSDSTISLWKVAGDGTFTQQTYTDPAGYVPVAMAAGTGGDVRLLWSNGQGGAVVWTIASGGAYTSKTYPIVSTPYRLVSVAANPNGVTAGDSTTGTVTLSSAAPAGGVTVSLSSNTGVVVVPYSITVPGGASAANFAITTNRSAPYTTATVTANYAGSSVSTSITVAPVPSGPPPPPTGASPDYKIFANPVNADVTESVSGSVNTVVTISVSPVNSFNSSVYLYLPTLPSGVTASLSSPVVSTASGDASSDLIFTVASSTRPGDYTINLRSVSGYDNSARYTPISLTVSPPVQPNANFTLSEDTDGLELEAGSTDKVMLTLNPGANFGSSTVSLSLQDDPNYPVINNGITATFSTTPLTSGSPTSTLTIQVGSQVAEGNYHLLIKGSNFSGTQTLVLTVFVLPNTDNATPAPFPSPPPYPGTPAAESSVSDMLRYDLNGTPSSRTSSAQAQTVSGPYNSVSNTSDADFDYLLPRFLGATDDRIYKKPTSYPYSAICKIVVHFGTSYANVGSGVLIGKNHVLTAAHILYQGPNVFAKQVDIFPGYDNGISPIYHHASVNFAWVPTTYDLANKRGAGESNPSDWAMLDLSPTIDVPKRSKGRGLGTFASYMHAASDFVSPANAVIAGYPQYVRNTLKSFDYLFYSASGIGDDGPVLDAPPGYSGHSNDTVYYTIDTSIGDSGGPIYHPDPSSIDPLYHVFAVVGGGSDTLYNYGTRINSVRSQIINSLMQEDKDEN